MTDWDKGYQEGLSGTSPPSDSMGYAGWVAGQRLREDNEARLRGPAADDAPGIDWSVPPAADDAQAYGSPVSPVPVGAQLKWLGLAAAFVMLFPVTGPAAVATVFGAPLLWLLGGTPRPAFARIAGAAFLGLVCYMASAGIAVTMAFDLTGAIQPDQLTADAIIPIALGQCVALAGFAIVAAWWTHRRSITPGAVVRAFVAGVLTVVLFGGALIGLAWQLGMT